MSKFTTIAEIAAMPTSDASWVSASFKGVVTSSKSPNGKMPGKATLIDPDNSDSRIEATFWGRDPSPYEGKICVFSGPGMKKGDYKDKPQVAINAKTRVDVFQDGEPGKHMPLPATHKPVAVAAAPASYNFDEELVKIQMLWLHALRTGLQIQELARLSFGHELSEEQFQSCVSSIFIEANRKGLGANPPPLKAIKSQDQASVAEGKGPF